MKYISDYANQKRTFEIDSESEVDGLPTHKGNNVGIHSNSIIAGCGC